MLVQFFSTYSHMFTQSKLLLTLLKFNNIVNQRTKKWVSAHPRILAFTLQQYLGI